MVRELPFLIAAAVARVPQHRAHLRRPRNVVVTQRRRFLGSGPIGTHRNGRRNGRLQRVPSRLVTSPFIRLARRLLPHLLRFRLRALLPPLLLLSRAALALALQQCLLALLLTSLAFLVLALHPRPVRSILLLPM